MGIKRDGLKEKKRRVCPNCGWPIYARRKISLKTKKAFLRKHMAWAKEVFETEKEAGTFAETARVELGYSKQTWWHDIYVNLLHVWKDGYINGKQTL